MANPRYPFAQSWRWCWVRIADFFIDWFAFYHHSAPPPQDVKRIVVVRLDQIGDLVSSLPVFEILKRKYPSASVTALVGEAGDRLLDHNPYVDDVLVFKRNWFSREKGFDSVELYDVMSSLRTQKFDLGFDLRGDLRNILLMTLARVRYRIGYGIAGGAGLLHQVRTFDVSRHQSELASHVVSGETIDKRELKPQIYLSPEEQEEAKIKLRDIDTRDATLIALHPEAGYSSKEWGTTAYIGLVRQLLQVPRLKVLIFGLNKAHDVASPFEASPSVVDLVGKLELRDMMKILAHCHVFVGNDSGPSHVAQALGLKCVVLASGTNEYEKWGLWQSPLEVLRHSVSCSPCHLSICNVEGHPCMSEISVDRVAQAIQSLVKKGRVCQL